MTTNQQLLTTAEVGAQLRLTRQGVRARVLAGTLNPVMRLDGARGAYLFDPETIPKQPEENAA
jgi:hypothetical protein